MKEIKHYWIEDTPKIEDIKEAFKIVKEQDVVVEIKWYVPYSGTYARSIMSKHTRLTPEEYFEECIPHIYGV
jgi:hypothetical protein